MKTLDAKTRISLKNILFPTDFSPYSNAALPFALAIARQYGARIYALHVMSPDAYTFVPPAGWPTITEEVQRQGRKEAAHLEERLEGIPHEVLFRKGEIRKVMDDVIQKHGIDLLVMGTHGRRRLQKLLMGSVAEEMFRHAPCPVLTVGPKVSVVPEAVVEVREIVLATDFSPEATAAAPYAISLAQEHQAQLSLLYVLERSDAGIRDPEMTAASLLSRLHSLVPQEAELWCNPKCFVEYGSPPDQIIEFASKRDAGLVVLGVRQPYGHATVSTHLARGTAYKVVAHAACPVLTVRG